MSTIYFYWNKLLSLVSLIFPIFRQKRKLKETLDYLLKRLNYNGDFWTVDTKDDEFIFFERRIRSKKVLKISKNILKWVYLNNLNKYSD